MDPLTSIVCTIVTVPPLVVLVSATRSCPLTRNVSARLGTGRDPRTSTANTTRLLCMFMVFSSLTAERNACLDEPERGLAGEQRQPLLEQHLPTGLYGARALTLDRPDDLAPELIGAE